MNGKRERESRPLSGHVDLVYPTEFLKAADLRGRDVTVVIDHLEREELVMNGGKKDDKAVVHMKTTSGKRLEKRWVVGKTVLKQIAAVAGSPDIAKWKDTRVTMFPTTCRGERGSVVECIRVRVRASNKNEEPPEEMTQAPAPRQDFLDEAEDASAGVPAREPGADDA